jgi:phospholipid/cholesterol/gamma-HCH transport system substrate-binding protein
VTFAGKPVGEVTAIQEVKDARAEPSDETGRVYFYQLALKIDSSVDVYNTDEIAIRTTGLMGEKSIAILPKAATAGKTPSLVNDQVIYANSVDPLENTFNQITKAANRMEGAVNHVDQWFTANCDTIAHSLLSLDNVLGQGDTLFSSVNQTKLIPHLRESTDLLNDNLRLLRTGLDEEQLLHKIGTLTDNLDKAAEAFNNDGALALRNINQMTHDLASGTGTLGRLISGEDIYLRLNSMMSKAETLMNDINHYGLLFQYDKHWQRSRTKKANLLKALDTPREFRDYFEGEVDTMTTSLGRLTELLERAEGERENIVQDEGFKRQFGTLMRTIQSLSDSVKLYNEGLIAQTEAE